VRVQRAGVEETVLGHTLLNEFRYGYNRGNLPYF
jgi:hypothetical protein